MFSEKNLIRKELPDLLNKAQNSFAILNNEGQILLANQHFYKLYGYTNNEYSKKFGNIVFSLSNNEEYSNIFKQLELNNGSVDYITNCERKSGDMIWLQTTLTPIIDKNGELEKIIAVETDITHLKEIEVDLNQKNEHMLSLTEYLEDVNAELEAQKIEIDKQKQAIEEEKHKSEELLLNILPKEVAAQLKSKGRAKPRHYKNVTVMFTDFKNFTKLCENLEPKELVNILHSYFATFDDIVRHHFIEKIKTIGDAYMCAGGLPLRNKSHPIDAVLAALEIQQYMNSLNDSKVLENIPVWELRLGIHTGEVIAGVVGKRKFAYDIWGDTVNIASRMESAGHVGMINISGTTYEYIKDYFNCDYRGKIEVKNKGKIDMYFVNGIMPELSFNGLGKIPNEEFIKILSKI
ncbi:MAG: PAS domain-containing protein [Bacteroidales bacterium]|nr:PAS domain-containing protein [Bacteroidales bacterium]